ncbi:MAG: LuxR C-terminal-related transcriptional regulator [Gaiellaceae bacterium]
MSRRAVARVEEAAPLVEAKLLTPRLRADLIDRPRIQRALDQGDGASVTLVAAPPGFGKTTAVRAWCATRSEALAWVTLDASDNDPVRLWSYIATAVDRVRGGLGRNALRRLGHASGRIEDPVIELMNGLAAFKSAVTVVLDDLQSVTDSDCIESLDYAVDNLPATARLIVVTRADPALGLPQRRARGDLSELRSSELAFTTGEAYELLVERGGVALDMREVETLCERTEGWPAALYLALLWLRQLDDPHRAVRDFGGDHRFVADYLNHEVLGSLDDDARSFLLHASVLGQFTIELCEAALERDDAASVLRELERSNLFVARLEHGGWFRVHSLFGEFAGFQLAAREPGTVVEIHRRAAEWFRLRGLGIEAVEHAAAAGDHRLVAEILVEHHLPLIRSGGARTLLRWIRTLPEQQLLDHPELAMAAATAGGLVGSGAIEQRRLLHVARRAQLERPQRYTPYVDAGVAMVRAFTIDGGVSAAVLEGRRAVGLAEQCVDDVLVASLAGLSRALYFAGEVVEAEAVAFRAVEHPEAERRPTAQAVARATLALLALDEGHLAAARTHAEKARALIAGIRSSRSWVGANASAAVGAVLAGEGKLGEAERELMYAEHFFRDEVPTVHHAWLLLLIARVRCRRGRLAEGEAALTSAHEQLDALNDCGRVPALAADVERELEQAASRVAGGQLLEQPSEAELGVLERLATDLSVREIGNALFISHNTVRTHTRALYRKLGVNSRAEAVARATGLGLLDG